MRNAHLLLLIPYSQGFMIYRRIPGQDVEPTVNSPSPYVALAALRQLPKPRLVVLLDRIPAPLLGELVLRESDLCLIPEVWVQHIPRHQTILRARFTVQLLEAFLSEPIRLLGNKAAERSVP